MLDPGEVGDVQDHEVDAAHAGYPTIPEGYDRTVKGDRVEITVDTGNGVQTDEIAATKAGRRVEVTTSRGVVEVSESPQLAVAREVEEELGLKVEAGRLLLTDWLPPWGGWDDAVCLVFDGGVHDPRVVETIVRQEREIRSAAFCTIAEVREKCADFTARRIESALRNLSADPGPSYTESGRGYLG